LSTNAKVQKIFQKAVILPPIERAELVEQILESFNFKARKEIDNLWGQEAELRINAYEQGQIETIPLNQVFKKIDNSLS
jgi:putative addiction module component (TIGR02574 family)